MESVAVISASGKKLMPTNPYRARKLLKNKRAVKYKYKPIFTKQGRKAHSFRSGMDSPYIIY